MNNTRPGLAGDTARRLGHSAVAFTALALVGRRAKNGWVAAADRKAIDRMHDGRYSAGIAAARSVSALAEPGFVSALLAARALATARREGWRAAFRPCLVVASGAVVRRGLSRMIARPRPPAEVWLTEPEGFSLPSKHTTLAVLAAGACLAGRAGRPARAAPLAAAAVVGTSRVYLGVHWPSDILAAWLFADGWLRALSPAKPTARLPADRSRP